MTVLETLSGLLNSRKQAKTLMAELKARGLVIVEDDGQPYDGPPMHEVIKGVAPQATPFLDMLRREASGDLK